MLKPMLIITAMLTVTASATDRPRIAPLYPAQSCTVPAPWGGSYNSKTLVCFRTDPRIPYAVFDPMGSDPTGTAITITRSGEVWIVSYFGPMGEPLSTVTLPTSDCIYFLSATC